MKTSWLRTIMFALILPFLSAGFVLTTAGCGSPSARTTEVATLKGIGITVDGVMNTAAQLLRDGHLTVDQWNQIAAKHKQFQATYNIAITAVQANLNSPASPEILTLASQLSALLISFQNPQSSPVHP